MKVTFCRCRQCMASRRTNTAQAAIKRAKRSARRELHNNLHMGIYDTLPQRVLAGRFG